MRTTVEGVSLLPVRLALGTSMVYHGVSKLKPEGRQHTAQFFEQLGIRPGRLWSAATGAAELVSGLLALSGIATRPAALAVLVTQAVAIRKVHAKRGFDVTRGGFEFNLSLMAAALGLLLSGPGRVSARRGLERRYGRRAGLLRRRAHQPLLVELLQ